MAGLSDADIWGPQAAPAGPQVAAPAQAAPTAAPASATMPYDQQFKVHRNPDGSIALIGDAGGTRQTANGLEVDVNGSSNPDFIAGFLRDHPDDIANHIAPPQQAQTPSPVSGGGGSTQGPAPAATAPPAALSTLTPSGLSDADLWGPQPVNGVADAAKSIGSGLLTGVTGIADQFDPLQTAKRAAMLGLNVTGHGDLAQSVGQLLPGATQSAQDVGLDYQPQTTLGRYGKTIAQMAPNAALGPEGLLPRAASVVLPGIASESSADLAKMFGADQTGQNIARIGGGLVGGLGSGLVGAGRSGAAVLNPTDRLAANALDAHVSFNPQGVPNYAAMHDGMAAGQLPVAADPGLAQLGKTIANRPGPGGFTIRSAAEARNLDQTSRTLDAVHGILGIEPEAVRGNVQQIVDAGRAKAAPLYDAAYSQTPPQSDALQGLLQRPAARSALNRAARIAANEGRDPTAMGFDFDSAGNVVHTRTPSVQTLDYIKRGLDDQINSYRDATTGKLNLDEEGRSIVGVQKLFKSIVTNPNTPAGRAYGAALKASSDYLGVNGAFNLSRGKLFSSAFSPHDFAAMFTRASAPEQAAIRARIASDVLDRVNGPAGQLAQNAFKAKGVQEKLTTAFGPEVAQRFVTRMQRDIAERQIYSKILGGSDTAANLNAEAKLADLSKPKGFAALLSKAAGGADMLARATHLPTLVTMVGKGAAEHVSGAKAGASVLDNEAVNAHLGNLLSDPPAMREFLAKVAAVKAAKAAEQQAMRTRLLTTGAMGAGGAVSGTR